MVSQKKGDFITLKSYLLSEKYLFIEDFSANRNLEAIKRHRINEVVLHFFSVSVAKVQSCRMTSKKSSHSSPIHFHVFMCVSGSKCGDVILVFEALKAYFRNKTETYL